MKNICTGEGSRVLLWGKWPHDGPTSVTRSERPPVRLHTVHGYDGDSFVTRFVMHSSPDRWNWSHVKDGSRGPLAEGCEAMTRSQSGQWRKVNRAQVTGFFFVFYCSVFLPGGSFGDGSFCWYMACIILLHLSSYSNWLVNLSPQMYPLRNEGWIWPCQGKQTVTKPSIRPYFWALGRG